MDKKISDRKAKKLSTSETGLAAGIRSLNAAVAVGQPHVLDGSQRSKTVMPGKDRERHQDIIQAGLLGHKHFETALEKFDRDMTKKRKIETKAMKKRSKSKPRGKR